MSIVAEHIPKLDPQPHSHSRLPSFPGFHCLKIICIKEGLGDSTQVDTGQKIGCVSRSLHSPCDPILCPPQAPSCSYNRHVQSKYYCFVPLCLEGDVILLYKR